MRRVHCSTTGGYHTLFRGVIPGLFPGWKNIFRRRRRRPAHDFYNTAAPGFAGGFLAECTIEMSSHCPIDLSQDCRNPKPAIELHASPSVLITRHRNRHQWSASFRQIALAPPA